jgi:hypothetical protein
LAQVVFYHYLCCMSNIFVGVVGVGGNYFQRTPWGIRAVHLTTLRFLQGVRVSFSPIRNNSPTAQTIAYGRKRAHLATEASLVSCASAWMPRDWS